MATTAEFVKNCGKLSRENSWSKFASVNVCGHQVGGDCRISASGLSELRIIQTNGVMTTTSPPDSARYSHQRGRASPMAMDRVRFIVRGVVCVTVLMACSPRVRCCGDDDADAGRAR